MTEEAAGAQYSIMKNNLVVGIMVAGGLAAACSASSSGEPNELQESSSKTVSGASPSSKAAAGTLTPSNLPADICDTPGTKDFTGGQLPTECDAVIPQPNGRDICLYKFANVSGNVDLSGGRTAIVATNSMRLGSYISYPMSGGVGFGQNGASAHCGGGGAGYGTEGGPKGGGISYGSENAIPLLEGSMGGHGTSLDPNVIVAGGYGGSAIQLVSCGALTIEGSVNVDGGEGGVGCCGAGPGGGGGGSGGTILLEALSITTTASSSLSANGGNGGNGGMGLGGKGGTANSPPGASTCGYWDPTLPPGAPPYVTGNGAGGAVGRIRINVAAGTQPELLGSVSPTPSIGSVGTH